MNQANWLAEQFEANRSHLQAVAYRMLGSLSEADDAVQEGWLKLSRSDTSSVTNLGGWLTTVVARVCLDMLRTRHARREELLETDKFEPVVNNRHRANPEQEALLADAVGVALLVVLDTLTPAERIAFVLHDLFDVPFEEIAPIVERSPTATRQLASRARRRLQSGSTATEPAHSGQQAVVTAFLAAARQGDFAALLALLDPNVVLRADPIATPPGAAQEVRGAAAVVKRATLGAIGRAESAQLALINGAIGIVVVPQGQLLLGLSFTITHRKIVEINVIADPVRLQQLKITLLGN